MTEKRGSATAPPPQAPQPAQDGFGKARRSGNALQPPGNGEQLLHVPFQRSEAAEGGPQFFVASEQQAAQPRDLRVALGDLRLERALVDHRARVYPAVLGA
jgi:hypothetical protein